MLKSFYVAAIGASAGGLDALREFFENLSPNTGISFVVITHLLRGHKSMLTKILQNHTSMPVVSMSQNLMVQPNQVFVMPEDVKAEVRNGVFKLQPRTVEEVLNKTIDQFFISLAKEQQSKAIGIIFSGLGSDGAQGANEIHRFGGTVLVQDPATAKFSSMPMSAIIKDNPDRILAPGEIAEILPRILELQERGLARSADIG